MKDTYITYLHLLTPLHTGGSADEGNMMGIAREVHTEFPYLPASSLRGKIRAELEREEGAEIFFGQKIKDGQQPTEGEVWFADATLIFFPIASLNHHLVWITCPLWLERWNRWLKHAPLKQTINKCRSSLTGNKSALVSFDTPQLYLQTAIINESRLEKLNVEALAIELQPFIKSNNLIGQILGKLVVLTDEDCIGLVETGLQREVRVALEEGSKTVKGGSFRSEEAIPPESILFFTWGMKPTKEIEKTRNIRQKVQDVLNGKLQFGGLEGLGRGWADLKTIVLSSTENN
jgi:CRISPR-associated protein Cmr4